MIPVYKAYFLFELKFLKNFEKYLIVFTGMTAEMKDILENS
jgi:hypothetical protein